MPYSRPEAAQLLTQKIEHFLIANLGKTQEEASDQEFYHALSLALREEIMINLVSTMRTFNKKQCRMLYYLSMEYLPGKLLGNNITNTQTNELIGRVLEKNNRSFHDINLCDPDLGLGNGGLGRLASCFLDSLATLHYPAIGYGLRYQYGIFEQEIWNGCQVERPDCWLLNEYPWEFRKDSHAQSVFFGGKMIPAHNKHGDEVFLLEDFEEVRALPYDIPIVGYSEKLDFSVIPLRLWTTKESPRNFELQRYNAGELGQAGENTSLTDVLYPNDNNETGKRIRLKQEFLLVCASLQDILQHHTSSYEDVSLLSDKTQLQINDTHPALIIVELTRRLIKNYDQSFDKAWEITQQCCNYTNHTVLKEALEEWNEERMFSLLPRQYRIIQKLNQRFCNQIRERFPNDEERVRRMSFIENGQIKMANLAIYGSKKVNGVAYLHTEILKGDIFKDFYEMYPDRFINITNGVTPRRWLLHCNPKLANLISERIGKDWFYDFHHIQKFAEFASDRPTQEAFLAIKKENKEKFFDFLKKENPVRDAKGKIIGHSQPLGSDALLDVQIKRIHEYKRQLMMALHMLITYYELQKDINARKIKRMIVLGGKAAPGYRMAKNIILLFSCIARKINEDPQVREKIRFALLENYCVSKAELIIPASDLSEQISTAGMEASGTGNMKLSINGALTIGTEDGANIEMKQSIGEKWWPFSFGMKAEEVEYSKKNRTYSAKQVFINHPMVHQAVSALKDGSLVHNDEEHLALIEIHDALLDGPDEKAGDNYFVLADLLQYYEVQKKVEELYADPYRWAEYAIHNVAGMGPFSSDVVITNYVKSIWNLEQVPIDPLMHKHIQESYSEYRRFIMLNYAEKTD